MADIRFTCPGCKQTLEAPPELAGTQVECPSCQQTIDIPADAPPAPAEASASPAANACPECGAKMDPDAVLCIQCGFHTGLGRKIETSLT